MNVQALSAAETEALDPGVRRLVTLLRLWNFETTDSGDGVSKADAGKVEAWRTDDGQALEVVEVSPVPHVSMLVEPIGLLERFEELRAHLLSVGIVVNAGELGAPTLQGGIGYASDRGLFAYLEVYGVTDDDLPPAVRAWLETVNMRDARVGHV